MYISNSKNYDWLKCSYKYVKISLCLIISVSVYFTLGLNHALYNHFVTSWWIIDLG